MKPDEIMLSGPWFDETNIDKLPGYKRFNVHTKKGGGLSSFMVGSRHV